jgi:hypothetical protein
VVPAPETPPARPVVEIDRRRPPRGSALLGAVLSALFALAAAAGWFFVARATHSLFPLMAWFVGLAAGLGMWAGSRRGTIKAACAAAAMAAAGILVAKLSFFAVVELPRWTDLQRLGDALVMGTLIERQIDPDHAAQADVAAAREEADRRIRRMSAEEYDRALMELARQPRSAPPTPPRAPREIAGLFFTTMFHHVDWIFFALALASAFKLARFGGQVDPPEP